MGSGLEGIVEGRSVRVGLHQLVYSARRPETWAIRTLRRAAWRSALSVFTPSMKRPSEHSCLLMSQARDTRRTSSTVRWRIAHRHGYR